ncbi:TPA: hypothetical protein SAO08_002153 [Burkholderia multivorans]|uniref:hypothetical protein n=1 Tax=Burkholderia multivorans TaxID=87883 RepID=UPI00158AE68F|nr:hypothetical protein [Burkholderia multivorans]EKS9911825.1 hypothetical protein [Burkholderia multivorans]MBU9316924.1 hypothetical protein [Burkholderia multivorans]MDN7939732.1 hypothetical protein [Burkholderia multivorans]HEF4742323.1 hypothetical protein [Burkholderia multivorans]
MNAGARAEKTHPEFSSDSPCPLESECIRIASRSDIGIFRDFEKILRFNASLALSKIHLPRIDSVAKNHRVQPFQALRAGVRTAAKPRRSGIGAPPFSLFTFQSQLFRFASSLAGIGFPYSVFQRVLAGFG